MALERDFLQMASTTITVTPASTHNVHGAPQYSTASTASTTYPAAVEFARRRVTTASGKEVIATATIFVMSSSASIGMDARIQMRGSTGPRILAVDPVHDDEGQHHLEVYVA